MVSVAVPDSCLAGAGTRLEKTLRASQLARAFAIFGVSDVIIYDDGGGPDRGLLSSLLRYAEAPPHLRRRLFGLEGSLRYAGALSPLRTAGHSAPPSPRDASPGDLREGVVLAGRGGPYVDVGFPRPLPYGGRARPGSRVTVRLTSTSPEPRCEEARGPGADGLRGYRVLERGGLYGVLSSWPGPRLITSRRGRPVTAADVERYSDGGALLAFGSTSRGVHGILGGRAPRLQGARSVNFFPGQRTETVRVEEAVLGCLAVLHSGACRRGGRPGAAAPRPPARGPDPG